MSAILMTLPEILEHIIDLAKLPNNIDIVQQSSEQFFERIRKATSQEMTQALRILEERDGEFPVTVNTANLQEILLEDVI